MYLYNYRLLLKSWMRVQLFLLFKVQNRACPLRTRSSNIIHHLEGRSELRDALTCEIGFFEGYELKVASSQLYMSVKHKNIDST